MDDADDGERRAGCEHGRQERGRQDGPADRRRRCRPALGIGRRAQRAGLESRLMDRRRAGGGVGGRVAPGPAGRLADPVACRGQIGPGGPLCGRRPGCRGIVAQRFGRGRAERTVRLGGIVRVHRGSSPGRNRRIVSRLMELRGGEKVLRCAAGWRGPSDVDARGDETNARDPSGSRASDAAERRSAFGAARRARARGRIGLDALPAVVVADLATITRADRGRVDRTVGALLAFDDDDHADLDVGDGRALDAGNPDRRG